MNNIHPDETDLAAHRDVITLRDYETCPTIKSSKQLNTINVVKSDGNTRSFEAGRDHSDNNHYKSLESLAVGGAHQ